MESLRSLIDIYAQATANWSLIASQIAERLFFLIATINLTWTVLHWMLKGEDPVGLFRNFVQKLIPMSFFLMIIRNFETWIPAIYEGFRQSGQYMAGEEIRLNPADIVAQGMSLTSAILHASHQGGFLEQVAGGILNVLIGLGVFLSYLGIALSMLSITIGGKIILSAGIVCLGFSASQWTMDYARKYITAALHVGLQLMFLTLIVSLGKDVSTQWVQIIENSPPEHFLEAALTVLAGSFTYLFLAWRIPEMGAAMLSGSISMNLGSDFLTSIPYAGGLLNKNLQTAEGVAKAGIKTYGAGVGGMHKIGQAIKKRFRSSKPKGSNNTPISLGK